MYKIDSKLNIEVTRGDVLPLTIGAKDKDGTDYIFVAGDVVRVKVMERKKCNCVVLSKDVTIENETTTVEIDLTSEETKIGTLINKPTIYWYEVELNPDTRCQTIIGYTSEDGAKLFTLLPEGDDA